MPTESAALWLSATARSARPMRVFWKKTASAATITEAITAAAMSICWKLTQPAEHLDVGRALSADRARSAIICFGLPPKTSSPRPIRK